MFVHAGYLDLDLDLDLDLLRLSLSLSLSRLRSLLLLRSRSLSRSLLRLFLLRSRSRSRSRSPLRSSLLLSLALPWSMLFCLSCRSSEAALANWVLVVVASSMEEAPGAPATDSESPGAPPFAVIHAGKVAPRPRPAIAVFNRCLLPLKESLKLVERQNIVIEPKASFWCQKLFLAIALSIGISPLDFVFPRKVYTILSLRDGMHIK